MTAKLHSLLLWVLCASVVPTQADELPRPNIVLIVADDLGYADLSAHGSQEIRTPHIDSIASGGARCASGYVSAPVCSPSRAGLLTGRHQQRFGHEVNFWNANANAGLPPWEMTFVERLRGAGYATGMVGKWHLGKEEPFHPLSRGFEEFFGDPGHGSSYLPDKDTGIVGRTKSKTIYHFFRNREEVEVREHLTDVLAREAAGFIERHAREPFFLYAAFNAPHAPMQSTEKYLARCAHIENPARRTYAAMVTALDDGVGKILAKLREYQIGENTIVFFLSDNGGDSRPEPGGNSALNTPFNGGKGTTLEGGLHVPFFVRWPARLPAGQVYEHPVISLDLAPTFLAAAGVNVAPEWKLDGVDLMPFLSGGKQGAPHERLFWRYWLNGDRPRLAAAVREGDWKLVTSKPGPPGKEQWSLFNLAEDPAETRDLAAEHPERVAALRARWEAWNGELRDPLWNFKGTADSTPFVWPEK